jgi:E3 ubiquitin-protein ligase HUWE1
MLQKTSVECDGDVNVNEQTAGSSSLVIASDQCTSNQSAKMSSDPTVMSGCTDVQSDASVSARLEGRTVSQPTWLSISLDAALGCRANVFQISRNAPSPTGGGGATSKKHNSVVSTTNVGIHPQASPLVCRHVLDTLISLAKSFPSQFLPQSKAKEANCVKENKDVNDDKENKLVTILESQDNGSKPVKQSTPLPQTPVQSSTSPELDFWEILVRLDNTSSGVRRGKAFQRSHALHGGGMPANENLPSTFEESALGQLMTMLAHPVVKRSQQLTDRLLRLLGLVSISLPDISQSANSITAATATTTTAADTSFVTTATTPAVTTRPAIVSVVPAVAANSPVITAITPIVSATSGLSLYGSSSEV